jgi:hypothetical protein
MSFRKHDLKFETAICLLENVKKKDFYEDGMEQDFHQYIRSTNKNPELWFKVFFT